MNNKEKCIEVKPYLFSKDKHLCMSTLTAGKEIKPQKVKTTQYPRGNLTNIEKDHLS